MTEKLNKIIAAAGISSRRKAEALILTGRVTVNGVPIFNIADRADAASDIVAVDGVPLSKPGNLTYIAVNKPSEVMVTMRDPEGREEVSSLLRGVAERVVPVGGGFGYSDEGLLLMTNDGDLLHRFPTCHSIQNTWLIKVTGGELSEQEIHRFSESLSCSVEIEKAGFSPWYRVRLAKSIWQVKLTVRGMGRWVEKKRRIGIGPLVLDVGPGRYRRLTPEEVSAIKQLVDLER